MHRAARRLGNGGGRRRRRSRARRVRCTGGWRRGWAGSGRRTGAGARRGACARGGLGCRGASGRRLLIPVRTLACSDSGRTRATHGAERGGNSGRAHDGERRHDRGGKHASRGVISPRLPQVRCAQHSRAPRFRHDAGTATMKIIVLLAPSLIGIPFPFRRAVRAHGDDDSQRWAWPGSESFTGWQLAATRCLGS